MTRYEALQPIAGLPVIPRDGAKPSVASHSARAQFGRTTSLDMGALPPNPRDLTHSARTAATGASVKPAPAVPALSRCSSRIPALLYPPLRPSKRTLWDGYPATPDKSLANKTGQVHLLPTCDNYQFDGLAEIHFGSSCAGSVNRNVAPSPSRDSTQILPPYLSTIR